MRILRIGKQRPNQRNHTVPMHTGPSIRGIHVPDESAQRQRRSDDRPLEPTAGLLGCLLRHRLRSLRSLGRVLLHSRFGGLGRSLRGLLARRGKPHLTHELRGERRRATIEHRGGNGGRGALEAQRAWECAGSRGPPDCVGGHLLRSSPGRSRFQGG
ncbi:uncharacterized protein BO66DRAFT_110054 [Aspergillus aculeatinus CBS 121060]|uniref:Uncharacterized protein n=1 Tax=Aspergillus aculeatinus CBS 121060 TaxID=1448322 RepID=A0ACD1HL21_9EURO|nr:hypothetical protein BO66DRAFT_110054 [Aspergillus aculeatinus CBS 121060]RAH74559.1 hypothetical protein BO66DRAFT_110054 [Aspergillus aculeatinus CBS 121060]